MPDNRKEGNLPEGGGDVIANDALSLEGSQPLEGDLASLVKRITDAESQLKALQSGKDKRWNKVEKLEEDVVPLVQRIAKVLNVDESDVHEAQKKLVLEDIIAERLGTGTRKTEELGSSEVSKGSVEVEAVVSALGLKADSSEVSAIIYGTKPFAEKIAQLSKLSVAEASKPKPSDAQDPAFEGGTPKGDEVDVGALSAELDKLYKNPTLNQARIEEIEKKLGWN